MADDASAFTALAPRLVVHSTSEINALLTSSIHLPNFSTLLSPFKDSVERVNLRTHTLESNVQAARFPLRFDEADQLSPLGPWELHGGWLDQVGSEVQAKAAHWVKQVKGPTDTPWFDHFKQRLASVRPVVPHNTLSQPMVYLLVTSAQHPEPMNALADLYASTSPAAVEARYPFMDPNVLRYYVVLHDTRSSSVSRADSQALLDQVRKTYGIHCALLDIHSWDPEAPPPLEGPPDTRPSSFDTLWDPYLPPDEMGQGKVDMGERDAYHVRVFLRELVIMSLIPWIERNIQSWNESLAASRRGFTGRLFSAGRRFLSSNAANNNNKDPNHPHAYDQKRGWYPYQANEAQTRKLADWAFVLRDYKLAGSMYELVRKEFTGDRVWTDCAHACHMQALSLILQFLQAPHQSTPQALSTAESLIAEAHNATLLTGTQAAAAQLDDIKFVCLHLDALKRAGHIYRAPPMLVRSAGDVEEISAALLLEQAAVSNLATRHRRKAGFHYCLAAIRYETTGAKLLAQHCLTHASQIYGNHRRPRDEQDTDKPYDVADFAVTSWPLIENHIDQASGRQAYHLGQHESALRHFLCVLNRSAASDGDAVDQGAWDDLRLAHDGLGDKAADVMADQRATLDQTIFNIKSTRIVFSDEQSTNRQNPVPPQPMSEELERQMLSDGFEDLAQKPKSFNEGRHGNIAAVAQPFYVELEAKNPFDAWLVLTDVQLHLDTQSGAVQGLKAQKVDIEPRGSTKFSVSVTCSEESTFAVDSVSFVANGLLKCREPLQRKGARLQNTREQRLTPTYAPDHSLRVSVRQPIPKLQLDVSQLPSELLAGETRISSIVVKNCTSVPLANLRILSSHPNFILPLSSTTDPYTPTDSSTSPIKVSASLLQSTSVRVPLANDHSGISIPVLCRGDYPGSRSINFLLAYSSQHSPSSYLSATSSCRLKTGPSLNIRSTVQPTRSTEAPYQIAVEVQNGHIEEKVSIDAVYGLSPAWRLAANSKKANRLQPVQLEVQQSTAHVQSLTPIDLDAVPCEPTWTCHQLEKLLQGESIRDDRPGEDDVHVQASSPLDQTFDWQDSCLRASWLASRSSLRRIALRSQFPSVDKNVHAGLFRLFTQRSLDLVIMWSLPRTDIRGHHLVADLQIGPSTDTVSELLDRASGIAGGIYAESQRERAHVLSNFRDSDYASSQMPIKVIPSIPPETSLFAQQNWAHVQATFILHNQSLSDTCDLVFALTAPTNGQLSGRWSGKTKFTQSLPPGAHSEIKASVAFTQPGLCQTGGWVLQAQSGKQKWQEAGEEMIIKVQSSE